MKARWCWWSKFSWDKVLSFCSSCVEMTLCFYNKRMAWFLHHLLFILFFFTKSVLRKIDFSFDPSCHSMLLYSVLSPHPVQLLSKPSQDQTCSSRPDGVCADIGSREEELNHSSTTTWREPYQSRFQTSKVIRENFSKKSRYSFFRSRLSRININEDGSTRIRQEMEKSIE